MAWMTLGDGERARLQARGALPDCEGLNLSYTDLPFYEAGGLVCAELEGNHLYMVAAGDGPVSTRRLLPVRDAWEIHDANDICGLRITAETAGDYLRFFCAFIATPDGSRFSIVEELDAGWTFTGGVPPGELALTSTPCEEGFLCTGYMEMDGILFAFEAIVHDCGAVEMTEDRVLATRRTLH